MILAMTDAALLSFTNLKADFLQLTRPWKKWNCYGAAKETVVGNWLVKTPTVMAKIFAEEWRT